MWGLETREGGDGFHLGAFVLYRALCQARHVFAHLIITLTWTQQRLLTHFTDEETEAEKGDLTYSTSHI